MQKIKTLLDFVGRSCVSELTVSDADTTVVIRNPARQAAVSLEISAPVRAKPSAAEPARLNDQAQGQLVRASTAGIVHQSSGPGSTPIVTEGSQVEVGQALCIVEAMKVFTTISMRACPIRQRSASMTPAIFEYPPNVGKCCKHRFRHSYLLGLGPKNRMVALVYQGYRCLWLSNRSPQIKSFWHYFIMAICSACRTWPPDFR
ncbi:hypothetical protein DQW09_31925 (plasmid) [Ensifer adhaerens]|nr:hypothetical protein DQW09_31925 [Ensifer adhaerens]